MQAAADGMGERVSVLDDRKALVGLEFVDGSLAGPLIGMRVKSDLLAFAQCVNARALESGSVDENVLAAVVRLDEAEAFLIVVELHGARGHGIVLRFRCT